MAKEREHKLFIKVTPEFDEKFTAWAKRFGMLKSQFGNLCVQTGLNHVINTVNPVESFSPEQLVAIAKAAGADQDIINKLLEVKK